MLADERHTPARAEQRETFCGLLRDLAAARPDDPAFIVLEGGEEAVYSYSAVYERAVAMAAHLRSVTAPGDRAIIMLGTGIDYVAAFFGCLLSGVIAVPAFPPEKRRHHHQARLGAIIADSDPAALFIDRRDAETVADANPAKARLVICEDISSIADVSLDHSCKPEDIALLQYTSGSTASPKGVMVTHANLLANARQMLAFASGKPGEKGVSWLPLFHDMGLMGGVLQPIFIGIPMVLMPPAQFLARPRIWLETISRHRATSSGGPDFAYKLCADFIRDKAMAGLDLSSWQVAFSGSEPVRASTMEAFSRKFSAAGFNPRSIFPCYGLAEATLFVSGVEADEGLSATKFDATQLAAGNAVPVSGLEGAVLVSCGRPEGEQSIEILNVETGESLAEGRVGEIAVSGPNVAAGYWRNREASAETFIERGRKRFLLTGDLGFMHGRALYIAGRKKDLIIIRGQNIYPADVEEVLARELDFMRPGKIAAFAAELKGEECIGVALELAPATQKIIEFSALAERIAQAAGEAFSEPARVVVLLNKGALPRTTSGKLQRSAVKEGWLDCSLDHCAIFEDGKRVAGEG